MKDKLVVNITEFER